MRRIAAIWLLGGAFLSIAGRARAEPPGGSDPATSAPADAVSISQTYFYRGRDLMAQERYAEACAMFERAEAVHVTIGVLLNLGDCYEKIGRLASARSKFEDAEVASRAAGDSRESYARERAASLDGRTPRLRVEASSLGRLAGAELRLDGKQLPESQWATAIALDPGRHTLDATAPNKKAWSVAFNLERSTTVRVPFLIDAFAPGGAENATGVRSSLWDAHHLVPLSLLAVSAASLGLGIFFGLQSRSEEDNRAGLANALTMKSPMTTSPSLCVSPAAGDQPTCDALQSARDARNRDGALSYALYAAAGIFVVGAATSWLLMPKKSEGRTPAVRLGPAVDPHEASFSLSGSF
jgi:hypothetical protein